MANIPKAHVRRTLSRELFTMIFEPTRHAWEVIIDGRTIAEFDNHPDALAYAHQRAANAQRQHVEKLERAAYEARRAAEKAAGKRRMTAEKGTPEKRVQTHNTPPKDGSRLWVNPHAVDTPEVKPGDHVTFDALGRKAIGTVTRWDEDGITIREESPHPDAEQIKEFAEHTGLHLSEWQISYLTRLLQKGHP